MVVVLSTAIIPNSFIKVEDVSNWPLAAVTLDRLGTTAIEGTTDQMLALESGCHDEATAVSQWRNKVIAPCVRY
jgi:hypothetical protein